MVGPVDLLGVFVDYQARLRRLLTGRLKSPQVAEDLTQDLYFKLPRVAERFPTRDDAQRYLVRMALNAALDHQRVEGRRAELLQGVAEQADYATASPEHELVARDEVEQLERALKDLPAKCRDVLFMSRVQGMTHAEIAAELGVSKSLVDKYAVRALVHCRERLNRAELRRRPPLLEQVEAEARS